MKTHCIMYALRLVLWVLFPFAVLGFIIKFCFSWLRQIFCVQRRVVGIFSFSCPEDYHWITQGLNSPMFKECVKSTFASVILNNNSEGFRQAVDNCDFAILYHTKNRGRINLTNVTDSIYDEELRYISKHRGRQNVIIVIDDLERNDNEVKHHILQTQTDIAEYARDLILVSSQDKLHQRDINNKLQKIRDLMSDDFGNQVNYRHYLSSITRWVCGTLMHSSHQSPDEGLDAPLLV